MSSAGAAPRAAVSSARAAASRKNGARSRGPKTAEGKARSAQNALKHGLRAETHVVLPDEDRDEFATLETALEGELAPDGALQHILARRVARAAWRLMRADRVEAELFELHDGPTDGLGRALIRDGHGTRSFETLLRYRGAALAELWRALRTLKALQAEAAAPPPAKPAPVLVLQPQGRRSGATLPPARSADPAGHEMPNEPKTGARPGAAALVPAAAKPPAADRQPLPAPARPQRERRPNEPDPGSAGGAPAAAPGAEPPAAGAQADARTLAPAVGARRDPPPAGARPSARHDRAAPGSSPGATTGEAARGAG